MTPYRRLAFRNLWRRPGRTGLTVAAISAGTGFLILALGLLQGMIWDMVAGATENYHGHATVTAAKYLERRQVQRTLAEDAPPAAVVSGPGVKAYGGRVRGYALLSVGEHAHPAELLGVDPEAERGVSRLPGRVAEGRFLRGVSGRDMVLGRGLARRLGAKPGSEVAAMGQAADGSIAADLFVVVGILDSGDSIRDSSLAVVGRADLQEFLALPGRVHEWTLALGEPLRAKAWARARSVPGMEVVSWEHYLPQMGEMLEMTGVYRAIYAAVFYFAVLLVTINTMYMALLERVREFAVMGAVGLEPRRLVWLLMLEALMLSGLSALIGGALGGAGTLYLSAHPIDLRGSFSTLSWTGAAFEPVFRCAPSAAGVLWPVAMTTLLGVFVALLPAWKLYRLRPVEVLREV